MIATISKDSQDQVRPRIQSQFPAVAGGLDFVSMHYLLPCHMTVVAMVPAY